MTFPKLTFPLTVDFADAGYWIGDQGPFKYGAAVTAFFIGENIAEADNDGLTLKLSITVDTFNSRIHRSGGREERVIKALSLDQGR